MKKLLCLILALAMVLGTMGITVFANESNADVWDGTYPEDINENGWINIEEVDDYKEGDLYVNSAADFAAFAQIVNAWDKTTNPFTNKKVYLNVDIDLDNNPWIPIGPAQPKEKNRFYGSFYGQGHTISNLNVAEGYYYAGLFGKVPTWGYTQVFDGITIDNAKVASADNTENDKEGAGALLGGSTGAVVSDCHVTGAIEISGDKFVGGLIGDSYAQITDCSVKATGTITATGEAAGGLVGQQITTAGQAASVTNCSVIGDSENELNVTSNLSKVGGAIGNVSLENVTETTISGITVMNVIIEAETEDEEGSVAYIASGYEAENSVVANVSATLADVEVAPEDSASVSAAVAEISGKGYVTLAAAVAAAEAGDTIKLYADVNYDNYVYASGKSTSLYIPKGKDLTLDLNGYTISGTNDTTKSFELITIETGAVVTIDDTSAAQTGKIVYEGTRETHDNYMLRAYTIRNKGTLTVNGGTIENATVKSTVSVAINNEASWGSDGHITVNGGVISSADHWAIRTYINTHNTTKDGTKESSTIINGGTVYGLSVSDTGNDLIGNGCPANTINVEINEGATLIAPVTKAIQFAFAKKGQSTCDVEISENATIEGSIVGMAAKIGGIYYTSLDEAIAAAQAGDTVTILAGTYDAFVVPANLNNITFVGETDADGNNLVTIRTLEEGLTTNTGGIFVQPETATFKNLNITAGTTAYKGGWMTSSLGNTNGETGAGSKSSLKQLNVENVNFTGAGKHSAIWMNSGSVNFVNSTVDNYAYGVYVYAINDGQVVNVTGSELSTSNRVVFNQEGSVNGKVNITDSVIDAPMLTVGAGVPATLTGNDIEGVTFYIYGETEMTENALVDCTYSTGGNGEITLAENYVNNVNEIVDRTFVRNINFVSYYGTEEDLANKANLVNVEEKANKVYVQYRKIDSEEGTDKYEIVLVGADDVDIHELASADLTFDFEGTLLNGAAMDYAVEAAEGVSVTKLGDRYLFNYNGVDKYEDSGAALVIGTITIEGYGSYTLKTDESVDTNAVYATKIADNIVEGFTPAAKLVINAEIADDDDLVGVIDATIAVPVRDLAIEIDFNNAVDNQSKAYQAMQVVISGGDLAENIEIELGSDAEEVLNLAGKADAAVAVAYADNAYTVNVTDALTLNRAYTVTVSGAGYRTARYTVTMTEDKELSFWNNVMDNATAVEEGEFETTKTFLAGDIVKDNNINIYDLSAVVSYFATETDTSAYSDYAKYDLDRNGVIDSKDVAYVLVSWGE